MSADGLSDADIEAVIDHLAVLRINDLIPAKHHILKGMLQAVAAPPTAMNIDVAQGTYLRGMALAEIDRRYDGLRVEDRGLVDRIRLARTDQPKSPWPAEPPVVDRIPDAPPEAGTSTVPLFIAFSDPRSLLRASSRLAQHTGLGGLDLGQFCIVGRSGSAAAR